jgi:hypothetical protein
MLPSHHQYERFWQGQYGVSSSNSMTCVEGYLS